VTGARALIAALGGSSVAAGGVSATAALLALGIVQGATEFLPISSSGHLVLFGEWLGLERQEGSLAREVTLHLGTLVAVVAFCWRDLLAMLGGRHRGLWLLSVLGTAVTVALALGFSDLIEGAFEGTTSAGVGLLVTAFLLAVVAPQRDDRLRRGVGEIGWKDAVALGLFQSLALLPGVSRMGATLVGALVLGFRRDQGVRMAFVLAIPAVLGAIVYEMGLKGTPMVLLDDGMAAATALACLSGLLALKIVSLNVGPRALRGFAVYCLSLGVAGILSGL